MSIFIYFLFLKKKKKKKKKNRTNERTWVLFVRVVLTQGADRLWVVSCGVTRVVLLTFPRTEENRREARIHSPLPPAHCFALTTTPIHPLSFSLNLSLSVNTQKQCLQKPRNRRKHLQRDPFLVDSHLTSRLESYASSSNPFPDSLFT